MNESYETTAPSPVQPGPPQPRVEVANYKPTVTYTILGITVFVYLLQMASMYLVHFPGLPGRVDLPAGLGMKINQAIIDGQLWRLFTPMLLHDDRLPLHILSNMYFLVIVGTGLERTAGHWRFLLLYILAGFSGNVLSFLFLPNNSLGASTSLFGLMGAQAVFILQNRQFLEGNGKASLQNILTLIGLNVVIGITLGADNWGHIGGLVGGAAFAWFGGTKLVLKQEGPQLLRLEDVRGWHEQLLGAAFVSIVFGGLAAAKITGLGPF